MRYFLIIVLMLLTGCGGTADIDRLKQGSFRLLPTDTAYVSVPKDGRYGSAVYGGSGQSVASLTAGAFAAHMQTVETGEAAEDHKAALDKARAKGLTYLIEPRILHWEDRATEWSMKRDRVSVKLTVIKAATGETVASAIITGRSSLATFGGDHPEDLLRRPIKSYAAGLF